MYNAITIVATRYVVQITLELLRVTANCVVEAVMLVRMVRDVSHPSIVGLTSTMMKMAFAFHAQSIRNWIQMEKLACKSNVVRVKRRKGMAPVPLAQLALDQVQME